MFLCKSLYEEERYNVVVLWILKREFFSECILISLINWGIGLCLIGCDDRMVLIVVDMWEFFWLLVFSG